MSDLVDRAKYALEWGNGDRLHRDLVAEIERMYTLIQRGLPFGEQFKTPLAAGARAELREMAGMKPPGRTAMGDHQGGMCGINAGQCEDCEREVRLEAVAARARGDFKAERRALDALALMERSVGNGAPRAQQGETP